MRDLNIECVGRPGPGYSMFRPTYVVTDKRPLGSKMPATASRDEVREALMVRSSRSRPQCGGATPIKIWGRFLSTWVRQCPIREQTREVGRFCRVVSVHSQWHVCLAATKGVQREEQRAVFASAYPVVPVVAMLRCACVCDLDVIPSFCLRQVQT